MKIFLIGMMGSGKSFWSTQIAQQLNLQAYDLDTVIETSLGKTIAQIFEEDGESTFRIAETQALQSFSNKQNFILATGGGTPCFNNNMQWMNEQGITIWLNEAIEVLVKRLITEKAHRPLIKHLTNNELELFLRNKLQERKFFYNQAKFNLTSKQLENSTWSIVNGQLLNLKTTHA